MFTKKKPAPTTVAEAIAPFRQVKDNLTAVMQQVTDRRNLAHKRIADAEDYVRQVKTDEGAAVTRAEEEMAQAEKISAALATLLGDEA